jgi:hypothetical protein
MRFFGSVMGIYDSGLTAYYSSSSNASNSSLWGYNLRGGVYGTKAWRKTDLSLSYVGGYTGYTGASGFDGTDQSLILGVSHSFNRKLFLQSSLVGSMWNRAYGYGYGYFTPGQAVDPALNPLPLQDIYDSTTYTVTNSNTLGYQFSPRTSIGATGGPFVTKRTNSLVSVAGIFASGDISRRITRSQTLTAAYTFNQFNFSQRYGNSAISMVSLGWAWRGRRWDANVTVAGAKVESEGLEIVQLDPAIAAIVGFSQGTQAYYKLNYYPTFRGLIASRFRRSTVGLTAYRQIMPGNGVMLTSLTTGAYGYASYTGLRKWTMSARIGGSQYKGLIRFTNSTTNFDAGGQVGYQLRSDLQFTASMYYRKQVTTGTEFRRDGFRVAVGLSYSPGDIPLALW